jgi:hypothetical protein
MWPAFNTDDFEEALAFDLVGTLASVLFGDFLFADLIAAGL